MAELKKNVGGNPDPWKSDKETWQYVTVPDEDPLGKKFPNIGLNAHTFSAGETYLVPKEVADYIKDRTKVFNRSCIRLLQPNADMKSIGEVSVGSASAPNASLVDGRQIP